MILYNFETTFLNFTTVIYLDTRISELDIFQEGTEQLCVFIKDTQLGSFACALVSSAIK